MTTQKLLKRLVRVACHFAMVLTGAGVLLASGSLCASGRALPASTPLYANTNWDDVYDWTEVPRHQEVGIDRATFDAGGYQLYVPTGEVIVVAFENHNLYPLRFARSSDGSMYFVNDGNGPILYIPDGGYLENATVSGARWYPFTSGFRPSGPVYIGIAPSWAYYTDMGWYGGMHYCGGYWGRSPYRQGIVFAAIPGLYFLIGGNRFHGWDPYRNYCHSHPGWFRPAFYRRNIYRPGGGFNHGIVKPSRPIFRPRPGNRPGNGNKPNPGGPNKPWPGNGNKPNPGGPNKPWPGNGNKPNPGGPNKPWPGNGNKPNPGGPNKPWPGNGNKPNPGGPNKPWPGNGNKPNPGGPNKPGAGNGNKPGPGGGNKPWPGNGTKPSPGSGGKPGQGGGSRPGGKPGSGGKPRQGGTPSGRPGGPDKNRQ